MLDGRPVSIPLKNEYVSRLYVCMYVCLFNVFFFVSLFCFVYTFITQAVMLYALFAVKSLMWACI